MKINVSRLHYLLQIARSGGVLAAAEAMNLTPSAVSQQLARLESEVGVPLVTRTPRGVVLTVAARGLVELAENIEREVNEAALRVSRASQLPSGLVRFGGFQTFVSRVLSPSLPRWREELSGVHLEVTEAEQTTLIRMLRAAELDLIATEFDESARVPAPDRHIREVPLLDDPWLLLVPSGTQAAAGVVTLDGLRLPWLDVDPGSGAFDAVRRVRQRLPDSTTSPHRYSSNQVALALVAAGEGVALITQLALPESQLNGVEVHELPGLGVRRIALRYRRTQRPEHAVVAAVDFLHRFVAASDSAPDSTVV